MEATEIGRRYFVFDKDTQADCCNTASTLTRLDAIILKIRGIVRILANYLNKVYMEGEE